MPLEDAHPGSPRACRKPRVDASVRSLAPLGIGLLVVFGLAWSAFAAWFVADAWRLHYAGRVVAAEPVDGNLLAYVDAGGRARTVPRMKGWEADLGPDGRVALRVVDGSRLAPRRAGTVLSDLCLAIALFLAGPGMLMMALRHRRHLREDEQRRERLRLRGRRVPAASVRVVEEVAGGARTRRIEYRALVAFDASDGRRYEAASDRFPSGRPPTIGLEGLGVLFDDRDPLDSLVDEASPAMRAARRARPFHSL